MDNSRFTRGVRLLLACACIPSGGFAATASEEGSAAYDKGEYKRAVESFQQAIRESPQHPDLHYNLGNAWFKSDEQGRAILEYERALILQPTHPEARANLAVVEHRTGAGEPATKGWRAAFSGLSPDAAILFAAASLWLFLFLLAARFTRKPGATTPATGFVIGSAALLLLASATVFATGRGSKDPALALVVSAKGSQARFSPATTASVVAQLPAGSRVRVLTHAGDWTYCELAAGQRGWISSKEIERVRPDLATDS